MIQLINKKSMHLTLLILSLSLSLMSCGLTKEAFNSRANDRRLLKPGALDLPIDEIYKKYQYNFLDKYKITHDFIMASGCSYIAKKPVGIYDLLPGKNYAMSEAVDIYEKDNHTYQRTYPFNDINHLNPINFDRYVRSVKVIGPMAREAETDRWGHRYIDTSKLPPEYKEVEQGFQPICFESWQNTQHFLTIYLNKRTLEFPNIYGLKDGVISHEKVGDNNWWVQKFDYQPYKINSSGRVVESWVLPVANTGYVFIFELGANQDSLKNPQAHTQMQAIFRYLIESVKIEPIQQ